MDYSPSSANTNSARLHVGCDPMKEQVQSGYHALASDITYDSSTPSAHLTTKDGIRCPIKTIPAEIRNRIYELVLFDEDPVATIELLEAQPPTRDLLLACRQFYDESKLMHQAACRGYWSTTKFIITLLAHKTTKDLVNCAFRREIEALPEQTLSCIRNLAIRGKHVSIQRCRGIWVNGSLSQTTHHYAFAVPLSSTNENLAESGSMFRALPRYAPLHSLDFPPGAEGTRCVEEAMKLMEHAPLTREELRAMVKVIDTVTYD